MRIKKSPLAGLRFESQTKLVQHNYYHWTMVVPLSLIKEAKKSLFNLLALPRFSIPKILDRIDWVAYVVRDGSLKML